MWVYLIPATLIVIYFFREIFSRRIILSQTISILGFSIHWYGITMASAMFSGYFLARHNRPKLSLTSDAVDEISFWLILGGFLGARVYHVITDFPLYADNLINVFKIWHGGLSIYGAVAGGLVTLLVLKKYHNALKSLSLLSLLDFLTPSLLLGQIIGRLGNLFNYEAFGIPTDLPWKLYIPEIFRPTEYLKYEYFHPTFLYESVWNSIVLLLILKFFSKSDNKGLIFFIYLFAYNLARIFIEFLRVDSKVLGGIHVNAMVSLGLACVGLFGLIYIGSQYARKRHTAHTG